MQPLARAMREYVQLDIAGGGTPPSFEEAMDRVGRAAYTRREALKLGGAAGAALALSVGTRSRATASTAPRPLRTPSPGAHDARVVVVGAGLAGTTAAYRLAQQGAFPSSSSRRGSGSAAAAGPLAGSPTDRPPSTAANSSTPVTSTCEGSPGNSG